VADAASIGIDAGSVNNVSLSTLVSLCGLATQMSGTSSTNFALQTTWSRLLKTNQKPQPKNRSLKADISARWEGEVESRIVGELRSQRLRQFEERLNLDDGVVVGKRVKRLDEKAARTGLGIDVAECTHGHAAARLEQMDDAVPFAIVGQLLLKGPEHFWVHRLQLEADVVLDSTTTLDVIFALSVKSPFKQSPFFWKWVIRSRSDFSQRQAFIIPSHDMPSARNVDSSAILSAFDNGGSMNVEEFRM